MKKVILTLAVGAISLAGFSQNVKESDVPSSVKTQFTSKYPGTKVEKWEKEKGDYVAHFTQDNTEECVVYNSSGTWMKTKSKIETSMLPGSSTEYINKNYSGKTVSKAWKVNSSSNEVTYEAEVGETMLCFDADGKYVKSEKKAK